MVVDVAAMVEVVATVEVVTVVEVVEGVEAMEVEDMVVEDIERTLVELTICAIDVYTT